jgi:uncharacterized protein YjbI with pentapeptide repeats
MNFEEMLNRSYVDTSLLKTRECDKSITILDPQVILENTQFTAVEVSAGRDCSSLTFNNCILSQVMLLSHDSLREVKVEKSELHRLRLPVTETMKVSISKTKMNHVTLKAAKIQGTCLEDFSICNSDLSFSEFRESIFSHGIFAIDTVYIGTKFLSCSFEGVYLPEQMLDADFQDCTFKDCTMTSQMKLLLMRSNRFESTEKLTVVAASPIPKKSDATKSRFSSIR